jgi:deoxyribose-phosphate aldolase
MIESHLNELMGAMLDRQSNQLIPVEQLIHSIDLTLLDEHASSAALAKVNQDANKNQVAAVCVYFQHLHAFSSLRNDIKRATVINFPQGNENVDSSLRSIDQAAQLDATEIDYVLPYLMYLDGHKKNALNQCQTIIQFCKQQQLIVKIILETGAFPDMQTVYEVSNELIELGCDFLKTSTGKIPQGASLSAAFAILSAIKETNSCCGLKVSGGIKLPQHAYQYSMLAELMLNKAINKNWFRIGASSLLDELLKIK